ncbi:nuclear transport factor 2 family protein [Adhaeribacter rhizoryzae]|uniref:Nuclear transport factor 2 family protein n=1 Tax=Adhaeribacter rhizoryzae TaxID=2607907 RepID=A0A5M6CZB0_9BACT|nr:nuclear transport factor 2 family protein [Adhaeribacter rhizoryzae]KAA5540568.1 nuclear transport factor 2 family protein [Adhaeribacter rhizoryzae]
MKYFTFIIFFLLLTNNLVAQTIKSTKPTAKDQQALEAAVRTLFDSMRAGDTAMARLVMAPNFRIIVLTQNPAGQTVTREVTGKQFLAQIIAKPPQTLDERYWDSQVQIDGDLASFWCRYAFFNGAKFSHCGTDAFQLYRSPQGWRIVNLSYNIQREGCDMQAIPPK